MRLRKVRPAPPRAGEGPVRFADVRRTPPPAGRRDPAYCVAAAVLVADRDADALALALPSGTQQ